MSHKSFSILVPVYQNALSLPSTFAKLQQVLSEISTKHSLAPEIVFIDDGSTDSSLDLLKKFSSQNDFVQVVKLTKNFGQINALMAGLRVCKGDCAIIISADLQDPPELIEKMIQHWLRGDKYIFAEREDRPERGLSFIFSTLFWSMVQKFALPGYPTGGYDFCLVDRELVNVVTQSHEKNTHIFPLFFYLGYKPVRIPYTRQVRQQGRSQWTFSKKVKLSIDTFVGFSFLPIRLITYMGVIISLGALLFSGYILVSYFTVGNPYTGWSSLAMISSFIGGMILISLGIMAEYLWRILEQVRPRPSYVIEEVIKQSDEK